MKKFLRNISVILILVISSIAVFLTFLPVNEDNIYSSLNDKHKYIEMSPKNNIIVIGGSNVLMGIDSELMEEELDYNVVNMGINAGIGLRFMINDIKDYIKRGDIIVICSEYAHYTGKLNGESALLFLLKQIPSELKYISTENIPVMIEGFPYFLRSQVAGILKGMEVDPIQNRKNLNKNGDLIGHINISGFNVNFTKSNFGDIDNEVFDVLNEFYDYTKKLGADVVISYPSIFDEVFYSWKNDIKNLDKLLRENTNIEIISDYNNYKFTNNEMFDSIYHLNGQGRKHRTEQLIEDLKMYLKNK